MCMCVRMCVSFHEFGGSLRTYMKQVHITSQFSVVRLLSTWVYLGLPKCRFFRPLTLRALCICRPSVSSNVPIFYHMLQLISCDHAVLATKEAVVNLSASVAT